MNTSSKIILILGVVTAFAFVAVVTEKGSRNQYTEFNKNCSGSNGTRRNYTNNRNDSCTCQGFRMATCTNSTRNGTTRTIAQLPAKVISPATVAPQAASTETSNSKKNTTRPTKSGASTKSKLSTSTSSP